MANNVRYEINHNCEIVEHESALCADMDKMLNELFSQFGWTSSIENKQGSCRTMLLTDANGKTRSLNVFCGTIRNESRNAYEKKIQLGTVLDPRTKDKENTIILGIYVYESNDSIQDAIFVGYPIDENIRYNTNPSIRRTFVNHLLIEAKTNGFVYDKENNTVGFRAEFIYYYLNNYMNFHYNKNEDRKTAENDESNGDNNMEDEVKRIYNYDNSKNSGLTNLVVYGTPGCGKSYFVKNNLLKDYIEPNIIRTTFYQEYTNTDFVGQIMPYVSGENVTYKFNPGPFTLALKQAIQNPNEKIALVIEELNRGNAPSIFGDIFQLLDREDGKSEYHITNVNIQKYLEEEIPEYLFNYIIIPSNLSIIATMNTSDQNVFTLDTAFKRRWDFLKLKNVFKTSGDDAHPYRNYYVPGMGDMKWQHFVESINDYIIDSATDLQSEDKQLGVFFVSKNMLNSNENENNEAKVRTFAYKVLEYLWDDVAKFDRDSWFNSKIRTLDELVDEYIRSGKEVFKDGVFKE